MIYISQGCEQSIGLEVFFKSFLLLPEHQKKRITLIGYKNTIKNQLSTINLPFQIKANYVSVLDSHLSCVFLNKTNHSQANSSLLSAVKMCEDHNNASLFTLPTSKNSLKYKGKVCEGHTQLFRHYFGLPELLMVFWSNTLRVAVLTDHIPLKDVPKTVTKALIKKKLRLLIENFPLTKNALDHVYLGGINPHAGEGGLMGKEDLRVTQAINEIKHAFPQIQFMGPLSADTLHYHYTTSQQAVFVYMYHDQGLTAFKTASGIMGTQLTLGLPFLRFSVDHGTAPDHVGKNRSLYLGMLSSLQLALRTTTPTVTLN